MFIEILGKIFCFRIRKYVLDVIQKRKKT